MKLTWDSQKSMVTAVIAGIAASLCCVGPLVLLALGIGGAWVGTLTALAPYRPIAIGASLFFLGLAFWKLYFKPVPCEPGKVCAMPRHLQMQRILFWIIAIILLLLLAFPWYAHWFF